MTDTLVNIKNTLLEMLNIRSDRLYNKRESEIGDYIYELFSENGWETYSFEIEQGRPAIIGKLGNKEKYFGLITHIDTASLFFKPYIRGEYIHGRGACDTKGIIATWAYLPLLYQPKNYSVVFVGLPGEESDQIGSKNFNKIVSQFTWLKLLNYGIIGEPTNLKRYKTTRGYGGFLLSIHLKPYHSSYLCKSRFLRDLLLELIQIEKYETYLISIQTIPFKFGSTPTKVVIGLEWRGYDEFSYDKSLSFLERLKKNLEEDNNIRMDIEELPFTPPYNPSKNKISIFKKIFSDNLVDGYMASDAAYLYENGVTTVIFGPGNPDLAHTHQEKISIKELRMGLRSYLNTLKNIDEKKIFTIL